MQILNKDSTYQIDVSQVTPLAMDQIEEVRKIYRMPKFFIFGHARSGTTLLARLIRLHPEVHCNWQAHFFSRRGPISVFSVPEFSQWFDQRSNRWTVEGEPSTVLLRVMSDYLLERQAAEEGKRIVGDKTPNSDGVVSVHLLHAIYPDSKLIYIVRDGRDTAVSKRIQAFIDHEEFLSKADLAIKESLRREGQEYFNRDGSIFTPSVLRDIAQKWNTDVCECHREGQDLFQDRYFSLRYEDLLETPIKWMGRIWDFLSAGEADQWLEIKVNEEMRENPAANWHAEVDPDLVRALPRGIVGGWKQVMTNADHDLMQRYAGDQLTAWGYS
jgi:hypothetical protein